MIPTTSRTPPRGGVQNPERESTFGAGNDMTSEVLNGPAEWRSRQEVVG